MLSQPYITRKGETYQSRKSSGYDFYNKKTGQVTNQFKDFLVQEQEFFTNLDT